MNDFEIVQKQYKETLDIAKAEYDSIEKVIERAYWLRRTIEDLSRLTGQYVENRYKDLNEIISTSRGKKNGKSFYKEITRGESL